MPKVSPSRGFGPSGKRLWGAVTGVFEFDTAAETEVLRQLCHVLDHLDALNAQVAEDGVTVQTPQGLKAHPALVEARAQQQVMVKLADSLHLKVAVDTAASGGQRLQVVASK